MNIFDIAQLGIGIFSIGALIYLVPKFLKFMERQEENFRNTINNHLAESTDANRNLANVIKELLDYLKHQNGQR